MAISEDTAALVAAQLTAACMPFIAKRQITDRWNDTQVIEAVADTYSRIGALIKNGGIKHPDLSGS